MYGIHQENSRQIYKIGYKMMSQTSDTNSNKRARTHTHTHAYELS
jgi:hypothetical protein